MKIMLPSNPDFVAALQLPGVSATMLEALGIGTASHIGGNHQGYGDFIQENARAILD